VYDKVIHNKRSTCRVCGGKDLRLFLQLGPTPLANSFLDFESDFVSEVSYPLDVYFCNDCSLIQLLDVIDSQVLFRNYIYVTGTSDTIAAHNMSYAQAVVDLLKLGPADLIVEVASNDGSLLKFFQTHKVRTLGIEPATNIAEMANAQGVETVNRFFNFNAATEIREDYGVAKAVIGNNVLAHVDESRDFLLGCKELISEDGLVIVEVPYLRELLERLEYDTIYHEHLSYFSVSTLKRLCDEVGLSIVRIDRVPVHGGSLRLYAGRPEYYGSHAPAVSSLVKDELRLGLNNFARYQQFASDVGNNKNALLELLESLLGQGKTMAGYGAPAKGNTLLNYCHIDTRLIPYTVDKNPLKLNKFTPGMHIPVLPVDTLLERQPDYLLILAWNFAQEIMLQQDKYYQRGGRFIIPIPTPKVV
jgi:hypothetical protein